MKTMHVYRHCVVWYSTFKLGRRRPFKDHFLNFNLDVKNDPPISISHSIYLQSAPPDVFCGGETNYLDVLPRLDGISRQFSGGQLFYLFYGVAIPGLGTEWPNDRLESWPLLLSSDHSDLNNQGQGLKRSLLFCRSSRRRCCLFRGKGGKTVVYHTPIIKLFQVIFCLGLWFNSFLWCVDH